MECGNTNIVLAACFLGLQDVLSQVKYLTVLCLVTWPLNASEAGGELALMQTSLLFSFECQLVSIRTS